MNSLTTRAAVLVELGKPLQMAELSVPSLQPGQVLVKLICSGICGSQLGEIDGVKGPDHFLPHLLGHEGCATVLETGPLVKKVVAGQKVVLHWRKGSGLEGPTPIYQSSTLGAVRAGWVTTFNEHAVVSENRVTAVAADTEPAVAALLGCAVTTAMGVLLRDGKLEIGESLLVVGAGGLGLSMIQGAALMGAHPIIAVDRFENRLELARSLGATHTLRGDVETLREAIGRVDVAVDNTGLPELIELCYGATGPQGRVILVGVPRHDARVSLATLPLHFGKRITGSHGGGAEPDLDIPRYLRLWKAGRFPFESLITSRYPLDRVNEAIAEMRSGELVGRALLEF